MTCSLSFQEQRELAEVEYRDEHEEADEECGGDVLDNALRLGRKRLAAQLLYSEEHEQAAIGNGKREQVHYTQVYADESKEHQEFLEAAHPHVTHHGDNGDRTGERVDLHLALEHALEIAEDARRHFPAGSASFRKGFDRAAAHGLRFAEEHVTHLNADHVALVFLVVHRSERLGERIAIADDGNIHGLALAAVDDAHHLFVTGDVFTVDLENRVVLLDAGSSRSGAFYRREAHDDAVARVDTDIANAHLDFGTGGILRGNHEFFGNDSQGQRFTAAVYRQGDACPKAHANLLAEIVPALRGLAVHLGNGIARLYARSERRGILRNKAHDKLVCRRFLHAHHVEDHQERKREHDVDERPRKRNRSARTHGFRHKIALVRDLALLERIRVLARHGHVTTERDGRNAVLRLTTPVANQLLAKPDAERVHLDVIPLRDQKMAELVNRHKEAEG